MTLLNLITQIKNNFPNADAKDICLIVNELEEFIIREIFSPHGIASRPAIKNSQTDMNTELLLGDDGVSLYLYRITAALALRVQDIDAYNSYSALFNQRLEEICTRFRRNNLPVKQSRLKGGF